MSWGCTRGPKLMYDSGMSPKGPIPKRGLGNHIFYSGPTRMSCPLGEAGAPSPAGARGAYHPKAQNALQ